MSRPAPPLRFLGIVLGGWICLRLAVLAPGWWPERAAPARAPPAAPAGGSFEAMPPPRPSLHRPTTGTIRRPTEAKRRSAPARPEPRPAPTGPAAGTPMQRSLAARSAATPPPVAADQRDRGVVPALLRVPVRAPTHGRWHGSAWLIWRGGARAALAPGGTLGGSQAGGRLLYRLNRAAARPLSASVRLYVPLRRRREADVAVGIDWQPLAAPVHVLAERRQRLGRAGRSGFSIGVYGGRGFALARRARLDLYAQAGLVGLRRRDAFVDGAARATTTLGPFEVGGGLWGAAQPRVARLDVGPSAALRLPVRGANLRLVADWRFRIAGHAAPGGGPALALAGDF
jgi:hypothetical protein